jgi:hypothetical protein
MGKVISFRPEARRRASCAPPDGPAQILFFTGVRYYRDGGDTEETRKTRRSTSARSRRNEQA